MQPTYPVDYLEKSEYLLRLTSTTPRCKACNIREHDGCLREEISNRFSLESKLTFFVAGVILHITLQMLSWSGSLATLNAVILLLFLVIVKQSFSNRCRK